MNITYGTFAHDKVTDLLRRLTRAAKRRGYEVGQNISEPVRSATRRLSRLKYHEGGEHWSQRMAMTRMGYWMERADEDHEWWVRIERTLTLDMPEMSDSWDIIGTIEPADPSVGHNSPAITKTYQQDSKGMPMMFKDHCDHCRSGKRGRLKTVMLRHRENGQEKIVGSSCLWEYAALDISIIARLIAIRDLMKEGSFNTRNEERLMLLADFARRVALWAGGGSQYTKGLGRYLFQCMEVKNGHLTTHGGSEICRAPGDGLIDEMDDAGLDKMTASFINHVLNMDTSNSFGLNVKNAAESGVVTPKTAAFVGGAAARWVKEVRKPPEALSDVAKDLKHFGTVGSRWSGEMQVTVIGCRTFNGNYGMTTLITLTTDEGHVLKWFRKGEHYLALSDKHTLTGAYVKQHNEWQGRNETMVNRVSWEGL